MDRTSTGAADLGIRVSEWAVA